MTTRTTIVLVDADPLLRDRVRRLLTDAGFDICGEASHARVGIRVVADQRPDLCLLNVDDAAERSRAIAAIVAASPRTRAVALTLEDDEGQVLATLRAGGWGHLRHDIDARRLPVVLRAVAAGEPAIARRHVALLLRDLQHPHRATAPSTPHPTTARVSPREWQVIDLLRSGNSVSATADRLSIPSAAVRRLASTGMEKLGIAHSESAVRMLRDDPP